jgi:general secretion pathway protein A
MYRSFYNLNSKPFQITTDPKFLWLGEKHKEALATLKYGILENKGFLLLTGDIGTGKTALINALVKIINVTAIVAAIPDPGLESLDFFNILAEEFKMNKRFDSKGSFLIHLKHFLHKAFAADKKVLLIIDESQRLNHDLLEQIRLLSNIELNNRKLINIFFVGQTEFNDMLREERNKAIRQRISVTYHIEPLTENETWHYIRHRLKIAGTSQELFKSEAVQEIYTFSQGYPRLINIICDHALLTGYASGVKSIDVDVIKECEKELHIPINAKKQENTAAPMPQADKPILSSPSREQAMGRRSLFLIILLILMISAGYFFYSFNMEETPRFGIDDIAPQEYDSPALREKESFIPGVTDKNTAKQNKAEAASSPEMASGPETGGQTQITKAPDQDSARETEVIKGSDQDTALSQTEEVALTGPEEIVPVPDRKSIIYFKSNSNELPEEAFEILDKIAKYMIKNPKASLSVKGYTDSSGSKSYNISVSKFRANTIKTYLVGKGVNSSVISVSGLGPVNPISTNETQAGRNLNRRVEIELQVGTEG